MCKEGQPEDLPRPEKILGFLYGTDQDAWQELEEEPDRKKLLRETKEHLVLMKHFVSCVSFAKTYRDNSTMVLLSEWMTPFLEAFVVLVYANNYSSWMEKYKPGIPANVTVDDISRATESSNDTVNTERLYTKKSTGKGTYKGWEKIGIDLYNKMILVIVEQRKKQVDGNPEDAMAKFDKVLLRNFKGESEAAQAAATVSTTGSTGQTKALSGLAARRANRLRAATNQASV